MPNEVLIKYQLAVTLRLELISQFIGRKDLSGLDASLVMLLEGFLPSQRPPAALLGPPAHTAKFELG